MKKIRRTYRVSVSALSENSMSEADNMAKSLLEQSAEKPYIPPKLDKLTLVKCVKNTYNCSLMEAKTAVENFMDSCHSSTTKDF